MVFLHRGGTPLSVEVVELNPLLSNRRLRNQIFS
jgi:hypothetical protein